MKKFSSSKIAILFFAAPVIVNLIPNKEAVTMKVSKGFDQVLWPEANYTMRNTDFLGYDTFRFAMPRVEFAELDLSFGSAFQMLRSILIPSSIIGKIFSNPSSKPDQAVNIFDAYFKSTWVKPVDILDARSRDIDFNRAGFNLITDDVFANFDWDDIGSTEVLEKLHQAIIPHLKKYYPNATRFLIGPPVKRSATSLKAINGPHLDFSPDDAVREKFHEEHEIHTEHVITRCIMGYCDNNEEELRLVLGAWVPTMSTPVCDKPLAIMDASTISPDDVTTVKAKTNVLGKTQHLMFAFPKWSAVHKWYYYSYQTPSEMLLFHHYNRDKTNVWGNPHSSFTVSGCGDEHESRKSIETRIAAFFPKESKEVNETL